jgi:hypothetical protein
LSDNELKSIENLNSQNSSRSASRTPPTIEIIPIGIRRGGEEAKQKASAKSEEQAAAAAAATATATRTLVLRSYILRIITVRVRVCLRCGIVKRGGREG